MEHDPKSPKLKKKSEYRSLIMSLMYLARFTRPGILMPVSFLATRCSDPTEDDWTKAMRILRYLSSTVNHGMTYSSTIPFNPSIAAHASHHLYDTEHGHHGMVISNGSALVGYRSGKIII
jgi:hypothetical protein